MEKNPKISVIMPAYNSEKYIAEAIESILAQTYGNWELIAVDDGSTDRTGEIIDYYAAKDDRIYVVHKGNKGVSHARNTGLDLATGEWIAFLDNDDIYYEEAFETMLGEAGDADLVICNFELWHETIARKKIEKEKTIYHLSEISSDFFEYLDSGLINVVWGKLIRKKVIHNYFVEGCNYGEDTLFLISLLEFVGSIKFIPSTVYKYRNHDDSLSHQFDRNAAETMSEIAKFYINHFEDEKNRKAIYVYYIRSIIAFTKSLINKTNYPDEHKREIISALVQIDLLRQIPIMQYPLTPRGQRMAALLLIGDVDMIMEEFSKKHK